MPDRRKAVADAMEAFKSPPAPLGSRNDRYLALAATALPGAAALIVELTAKVEDQRKMLDLTRHRVLKRMGEPDMGKSWSWIEDAITMQTDQLSYATSGVRSAEQASRTHRAAAKRSKAKLLEAEATIDEMGELHSGAVIRERTLRDAIQSFLEANPAMQGTTLLVDVLAWHRDLTGHPKEKP